MDVITQIKSYKNHPIAFVDEVHSSIGKLLFHVEFPMGNYNENSKTNRAIVFVFAERE